MADTPFLVPQFLCALRRGALTGSPRASQLLTASWLRQPRPAVRKGLVCMRSEFREKPAPALEGP